MAILNMVQGKTPMMYRGTNTLYLSHLNEIANNKPVAQVYKAQPGSESDVFVNLFENNSFPLFFEKTIYINGQNCGFYFYGLQKLRTGPFTIEFFQKNYTNTNNYGVDIFLDNIFIGRVNFNLLYYFGQSVSTNVENITPSGEYRHIAVCRHNNNDYTFFVNGIAIKNYTSPIIYDFQNTIILGKTASIRAFIAELRISNIARYTSNFIPPTTPFVPD